MSEWTNRAVGISTNGGAVELHAVKAFGCYYPPRGTKFLAMPANIVFQRNPHFRSKGSCREPVIRVFPYPFKKGLAQISWCFALQFWTRQAVKEEVLILAELTRNLAGPTTGGAL